MKVSIIIPAYNEEKRLGSTLEALWSAFRRARWTEDDWEVLVVDDGSRDRTWEVIARYQSQWRCLRGVRLPANQGKGQALRRGVVRARGDAVVVYDADGATPASLIAEYLPLVLQGEQDIVVGSRELGLQTGRQVTYSPLRRRIGRIFARLAASVVPGIADTQCGFKFFRREVARDLFPLLKQKGFLWDVELLALARRRSYRVAEVPVDWRHQPGSKVRPLREGWRMYRQLRALKRSLNAADERAWVPGPACLVCGGDRWEAVTRGQPYAVVRCAVCGLGMINPRPGPQALRAYYDERYFSRETGSAGYADYLRWEPWIKKTAVRRLDLIERWIRPPGRLLEIGCAAGFFLEVARSRGWDVRGIELSPWAARIAQERLGSHCVVQRSIEEAAAELGDAPFDVVVGWDVLEHLLEPDQALSSLYAAMTERGILAVTTPDAEGWLARWMGPRWMNYAKLPEHIYMFGRQNLCELLWQQRFQPLVVQSHGKHVPAEFFLARLLQLFGKSPRRLPMPSLSARWGFYCNPTDIVFVLAGKIGSGPLPSPSRDGMRAHFRGEEKPCVEG